MEDRLLILDTLPQCNDVPDSVMLQSDESQKSTQEQ